VKNFAKAWDVWANYPFKREGEVNAAMSLWGCTNSECPITVYSAVAGLGCPECGQAGSFVMPMKRTERPSLRSWSDWKTMLLQAPETRGFQLAWPAVGILLSMHSAIWVLTAMGAFKAVQLHWSQVVSLTGLSVIGTVWLTWRLSSIVTRGLIAAWMMFTVRQVVPADDEPSIQEEAWS